VKFRCDPHHLEGLRSGRESTDCTSCNAMAVSKKTSLLGCQAAFCFTRNTHISIVFITIAYKCAHMRETEGRVC